MFAELSVEYGRADATATEFNKEKKSKENRSNGALLFLLYRAKSTCLFSSNTKFILLKVLHRLA